MTTTFISTSSLTSTLRLAAMKSQVAQTAAAKEATDGRHADMSLSLGALTGRDLALRAEHSRLEKIVDTNEIVAGRLSASQTALTTLVGTAQTFLKELIAARDTDTGAEVLMPSAKTNLSQMTATLNTTLYGQYMFGGINSGVKTMNDYTPTSTAKAAVDAAFLAQFGFTQGDSAVAGISAADMTTFLDTTFANLFTDPAWGTTWSSASDENIQSRVSTTQVIQTSANANESGIRKLAMVYTMMSDLGSTKMSEAAYQTLVGKAIALTTEGIGDITLVQGRLGTAEERVKSASETMKIQQDLMVEQISALESVDAYEASVRVTLLQKQVDTALALMARIQQTSILSYLT
jgi:flagellar hook-associated protein 3 FlgL